MGVGYKSVLVERDFDDVGHFANVAGMTVTVVQCIAGKAVAVERFPAVVHIADGL